MFEELVKRVHEEVGSAKQYSKSYEISVNESEVYYYEKGKGFQIYINGEELYINGDPVLIMKINKRLKLYDGTPANGEVNITPIGVSWVTIDTPDGKTESHYFKYDDTKVVDIIKEAVRERIDNEYIDKIRRGIQLAREEKRRNSRSMGVVVV